VERLINVFGGSGFVGGKYEELTPNILWSNERNDYKVKSNNTHPLDIVYFISTIDNYNVHTDPFIDIDTNLTTLIKVLESCKDKNVCFNFISSWFVYGDVELPAKENSHCDPKGFYSITKRTAEQLLISYCETFGIQWRILRLGNVLGKDDKKVSKKKNALQYLINEIKENRDINLYDGGDLYRDYIHVDDVVQAINLVIVKGPVGEIYNIGNGEKVYLRDSLEYVRTRLNSTSKFNSIGIVDFHKKVQTKNMVLDISKIQQLGYVPKYNTEQMLDSLL
jgi:nucleoside-diphosphate-sugar epimerase